MSAAPSGTPPAFDWPDLFVWVVLLLAVAVLGWITSRLIRRDDGPG